MILSLKKIEQLIAKYKEIFFAATVNIFSTTFALSLSV